MSDKPETKVYGIPGDLAEIGVPVWTPATVRRYATELAARLDDPKIEDKYRLARHRKIERARKLGDRDPYRAAELLRRLVNAGVPVTAFTQTKTTLEEMYLRSGVKQVD